MKRQSLVDEEKEALHSDVLHCLEPWVRPGFHRWRLWRNMLSEMRQQRFRGEGGREAEETEVQKLPEKKIGFRSRVLGGLLQELEIDFVPQLRSSVSELKDHEATGHRIGMETVPGEAEKVRKDLLTSNPQFSQVLCIPEAFCAR